MAGAHYDVKRAELLDILEYFRFGKPLTPAIVEINGIDRLRTEVGRRDKCAGLIVDIFV